MKKFFVISFSLMVLLSTSVFAQQGTKGDGPSNSSLSSLCEITTRIGFFNLTPDSEYIKDVEEVRLMPLGDIYVFDDLTKRTFISFKGKESGIKYLLVINMNSYGNEEMVALSFDLLDEAQTTIFRNSRGEISGYGSIMSFASIHGWTPLYTDKANQGSNVNFDVFTSNNSSGSQLGKDTKKVSVSVSCGYK